MPVSQGAGIFTPVSQGAGILTSLSHGAVTLTRTCVVRRWNLHTCISMSCNPHTCISNLYPTLLSLCNHCTGMCSNELNTLHWCHKKLHLVFPHPHICSRSLEPVSRSRSYIYNPATASYLVWNLVSCGAVNPALLYVSFFFSKFHSLHYITIL